MCMRESEREREIERERERERERDEDEEDHLRRKMTAEVMANDKSSFDAKLLLFSNSLALALMTHLFAFRAFSWNLDLCARIISSVKTIANRFQIFSWTCLTWFLLRHFSRLNVAQKHYLKQPWAGREPRGR